MDVRQLFNKWVILSALLFAGLLFLITLLAIEWSATPPSPGPGLAPAYLTVIPAPTATPNVTPTATIDPFAPSPTAGGLTVGGYAQITGTGGDGLRIRAAPGLSGEPVFLGLDAEVFLVQDGPREADGYVWWYIVAPYDQARAGWAAADFLTYIPAP
jgi:hypothetical protein